MQLPSARPNGADGGANEIRKEKKERRRKGKEKKKERKKREKKKKRVVERRGAKNTGTGGDQPRYMAKARVRRRVD